MIVTPFRFSRAWIFTSRVLRVDPSGWPDHELEPDHGRRLMRTNKEHLNSCQHSFLGGGGSQALADEREGPALSSTGLEKLGISRKQESWFRVLESVGPLTWIEARTARNERKLDK
jgi:hypothetical protein